MTIVKALDIPRKWRLPDVPAEDEWAVKYQVVVPKTYRQDISGIALRKSKKRCSGILQVVSRPDGWETKSDQSPVIQEPFSRVIVDCVGPLPKTRSGN